MRITNYAPKYLLNVENKNYLCDYSLIKHLMNKWNIFLIVLLFFPYLSEAQQDTATRYETIKDMPLFYQQIKANLSYPMAWEKSEIKNFDNWREEARRILLTYMNPAPPRTDFAPEIIAVEKREGYEARKIDVNISAWSRIPAYLLVPEGKGPFPAIIVLHDHGAHFSIGKEKMILPFQVDQTISDDAKDWVNKCYDGR